MDATQRLLDKLLKSAHDKLNQIAGKGAIFEHEVMIHGIRVRRITNSAHLNDFWVDNWFSLGEWQRVTGEAISTTPRVKAYAMLGVSHEQEATYYSHDSNTVIFLHVLLWPVEKLGAPSGVPAPRRGIWDSFHSRRVR